MLTSRGWWFLFIVLLQIAVGLIWSRLIGPVVAIIGLVLFGWFCLEWLLFSILVYFALPKLQVERTIRVGRRTSPIIWIGQEFEVEIAIRLPSRLGLPYCIVQDRPPSRCERVGGRDDQTLSLSLESSGLIRYTLRCEAPGEVRFEGVRLQASDLQGFFYHREFRRQPALYLVLPALTDAEGDRRTTKSHNLLPPPGVHRLRLTGGGSELHDLREYRPGDPPKMIAWKASARRDRLITKEFESDVPVRCTLFVDKSASVTIGPPRETMLNQITAIASSAAQAALSDRDHVGLVLFDERDTEILRPARTSRHLIDLLYRLARAHRAAPISPAGDPDALRRLAVPLAHEIYPDLMDRRINRTPWGMYWRPLLDMQGSWFILALLMPLALLLFWPCALLVCYVFDWHVAWQWVWAAGVAVKNQFGSAVSLLISAGTAAVIAGTFWIARGLSGLVPPASREKSQRKQLSALFAALDEAPAGRDGRYLGDDRAFAERAQRFLAEHHRRYPVALYDNHGHYLFRSAGKIEVLAEALLYAVSRGKDNELFVLLVDLFELADRVGPLLRAVRLACARHHQVLVICPWLAGIPALDDQLTPAERNKKIRNHAIDVGFRGVEAQLFRQLVEQYHHAFDEIRRQFSKSGVTLIRAQPHESVRLILNRLDRLRQVRRRR